MPEEFVKTVWEVKGYLNQLSSRVRLVDCDGELNIEIIFTPEDELSFWERMKNAFKYLFTSCRITFGTIPLSQEDWSEMRNGVCLSVTKDEKGSGYSLRD